MIVLPQSKLKEEWVRRGIASVANGLIDNRHVDSDCGPLFHGMHALVVYRQRTVPGYLVPKFNSHVKLADRGKKKPDETPSPKIGPPPTKVSKVESRTVVPAGQKAETNSANKDAAGSKGK